MCQIVNSVNLHDSSPTGVLFLSTWNRCSRSGATRFIYREHSFWVCADHSERIRASREPRPTFIDADDHTIIIPLDSVEPQHCATCKCGAHDDGRCE